MRRLSLLAALLVLIAGCAGSKAPETKTAQDYMQEGDRLFERELYEDAISSYEKVRETYYSPEMNIRAELNIANAYFLGEDYPEAAAAYEDFLKQHPDHERTDEVLYKLGLSYYEQLRSADQDQTATRNALITFQTLLKRYPDDEHAEAAKTFIRRCLDLLAAHELYVGRFYLRDDHPDAAISRFKRIFERYPEYRQTDEVYFYLGKAYLEKGEEELADQTFRMLLDRYPQSEHVEDARELLAKKD